jgi:hypothetical protein
MTTVGGNHPAVVGISHIRRCRARRDLQKQLGVRTRIGPQTGDRVGSRVHLLAPTDSEHESIETGGGLCAPDMCSGAPTSLWKIYRWCYVRTKAVPAFPGHSP